MKQQKKNQQKGIIELLKLYPWTTGVKITELTGYAHPITVISRIRTKYGDESVEHRNHVDQDGKTCNYYEYRLSDSFRAMMEVKDIPKKPFPTKEVFK